MGTDAKRTTIYIPNDLQKKLDKLKKSRYYKDSQSAMISHLIRLGADAEEAEATKGKPA